MKHASEQVNIEEKQNRLHKREPLREDMQQRTLKVISIIWASLERTLTGHNNKGEQQKISY